MDTKLTLKLNRVIIERAKKYASEKFKLIQVVEAYLQSLTSDNKNADFEISPFIKSLATGIRIPADLDH